MRLLYATTIFLSAALLFVVEPLFAKMVLPRLGGTPAVWNTCMVFFQAALLAGYAYAHVAGRFAKQPLLHLGLLVLPWVVLPLAIPESWEPPVAGSPVPALLGLLTWRVGIPFFVLATSGPLLQKWFARTGEKDPYYLYAASNAGSMIGLLGYPLVLEPLFPLAKQSALFCVGYGFLFLLTAACAVTALRGAAPIEDAGPGEGIPARRQLRWIALAAVPSAQMLGVTTYMTTDIAAVPLLWVIPLALYLLSFILVFARGAERHHRVWIAAMPFSVLVLADLMLMQAREPLAIVLPVHLVTFFVACMVCHGELAKDRPPARHLTAYYLLISVGGLIGGTLTALVAPVLLRDVSEYPLALVLACALAPRRVEGRAWLDLALPVALGAVTLALLGATSTWQADAASTRAVVASLPVFLAFPFSHRPVRFALGVGAVLLVSTLYRDAVSHVIEADRSFFGVLRVTHEEIGPVGSRAPFRSLYHGTTRHGLQHEDASGGPIEPRDPLTYYRREGPIGQLLTTLRPHRVGLVGLGTGTLAAYAEPGDRFVYFEIDDAVRRVAEERFTYLSAARERGAHVECVLGDARLTLARSSESFDVVAVDAFSSDAIPLHLVTREAIARVYLPRIAAHGVLAFHVSNKYLDLRPILGDLAADAGLACFVRSDVVDEDGKSHGWATSTWVAMARRAEDLGVVAKDERWVPREGRSPRVVWTDDESNILSAIAR